MMVLFCLFSGLWCLVSLAFSDHAVCLLLFLVFGVVVGVGEQVFRFTINENQEARRQNRDNKICCLLA